MFQSKEHTEACKKEGERNHSNKINYLYSYIVLDGACLQQQRPGEQNGNKNNRKHSTIKLSKPILSQKCDRKSPPKRTVGVGFMNQARFYEK